MDKKIYIGIGVCVLAVLAVTVAAGWYMYRPKQLRQIADKSSGVTLGAQTQNSIATGSQNQAGLNVDQNTQAANLGQLNGSTGQAAPGSDNTSTKQSNPFDPTTFAQYDKYKDQHSGLFAEVQKGTGDELTEGKKAAVYYRGWLTNGTLFDESRKDTNGQLQPFVFTLGEHQVISGWEQSLAGMKVGGVRLLIIPPAVGYGATGQGNIPPNAVLIFQVQLAAVQ